MNNPVIGFPICFRMRCDNCKESIPTTEGWDVPSFSVPELKVFLCSPCRQVVCGILSAMELTLDAYGRATRDAIYSAHPKQWHTFDMQRDKINRVIDYIAMQLP